MRKYLMIFLLCVLGVGFGYAKPMEVILLPTEPGTPSHILDTSKGEDYLFFYTDTIGAGSILVGLADADTFGVLFVPPCSSAIKEVYIWLAGYSGDPTDPVPYDAFIADPNDTIVYTMYNEYHAGAPIPGPSPTESFLIPPTAMTADVGGPGNWDCDTIAFAVPETIGYNSFFAGWVIPLADSTPNHRIWAYFPLSAPHRSLIRRDSPANGGPPGWYSSWHHFPVYALIELFENLPPIQDLELLPCSYTTGYREVTTHVWDVIGVPPDSHGIESVDLYYAVNYGTATAIPMTMISGDSTDGVWAADIPGVSGWDTVSYYSIAVDYNGTADTTDPFEYVIRAGTAGNIFFYNDDYYGGGYSHDAVNKVLPNVDFWDNFNDSLGYPDSSVIAFYTPGVGPGLPIIFVTDWGGGMLPENQGLIEGFLDAGGNLLISDMDICIGLLTTDPWDEWNDALVGGFLREYCMIDSFFDDFPIDSSIILYGVPGDPISGDFVEGITYYFPIPIGALVPLPDAIGIFFYGTGEACALRYEDTYKLVFLYWPFYYISDTLAQETLIGNIATWFGVGIEQEKVMTQSIPYSLSQNSPNPFRTITEIRCRISENRKMENGNFSVSLYIYDISGRLIRTFPITQSPNNSITKVVWNGKDNSGKKVASGVYFYRLGTDDFEATKKMIVLR